VPDFLRGTGFLRGRNARFSLREKPTASLSLRAKRGGAFRPTGGFLQSGVGRQSRDTEKNGNEQCKKRRKS